MFFSFFYQLKGRELKSSLKDPKTHRFASTGRIESPYMTQQRTRTIMAVIVMMGVVALIVTLERDLVLPPPFPLGQHGALLNHLTVSNTSPR